MSKATNIILKAAGYLAGKLSDQPLGLKAQRVLDKKMVTAMAKQHFPGRTITKQDLDLLNIVNTNLGGSLLSALEHIMIGSTWGFYEFSLTPIALLIGMSPERILRARQEKYGQKNQDWEFCYVAISSGLVKNRYTDNVEVPIVEYLTKEYALYPSAELINSLSHSSGYLHVFLTFSQQKSGLLIAPPQINRIVLSPVPSAVNDEIKEFPFAGTKIDYVQIMESWCRHNRKQAEFKTSYQKKSAILRALREDLACFSPRPVISCGVMSHMINRS